MGTLTAKLTDRKTGAELTTLTEYEDLSVDVPLNDSRLADVTLSVYDEAVKYVSPLDTCLKVSYKPREDQPSDLVFNGPLLTPEWKPAEGRVIVHATDVTHYLKLTYVRYGDYVVGTRYEGGYPVDGWGAHAIAETAFPSEAQLARGVVTTGLYWGLDTVTEQPPRPVDLEHPAEGDGLWRIAERGANANDLLTNMTNSFGGFDIDYQPVDAEHPAVTSWWPPGSTTPVGWDPGFIAQMNTYERQGDDRSQGNAGGLRPIVFNYGYGLDNCEDMPWTPDGSVVTNYAVVVVPGGERDKTDTAHRALAHIEASWQRYGILGRWDSSGQVADAKMLRDKAKLYVAAYGYPPDFIEIRPKVTCPWRYGVDYGVGDLVTAHAKAGYMPMPVVTARLTRVQLKQEKPAAEVREVLEAVPHIIDGEIGEEAS